MQPPPQWAIILAGALTTLIATLLTGWFVSLKDRSRRKTEGDILDAESTISHGRDRYRSSSANEGLAEVLSSAGAPADLIWWRLLNTVSDAYSAATGESGTKQQVDEWSELARQGARGDSAALDKLRKMKQQFDDDWAQRNNALVDGLDSLRVKRIALHQSAERAKFIGVGFQILGLMIVLLKDLSYGH